MDNKKIISIDEMVETIKEFGEKAIWLKIEKLGNWQERTAYRQLFFLSGGNLDED